MSENTDKRKKCKGEIKKKKKKENVINLFLGGKKKAQKQFKRKHMSTYRCNWVYYQTTGYYAGT